MEMGFDKFIWRTITDGKERELHKELNGTTWSFNDPPVIDERTGERGVLSEGALYFCNYKLTDLMNKMKDIYSNIENNKSKMKTSGMKQAERFDWKKQADRLLLYLGDKGK